MPGAENRPHHPIRRDHELQPGASPALPSELAVFLKGKEYAALLQATDQGTMLVVKAPSHEIQSVRGTVPMQLRHELYEHPAAPVIRLVTTIYDQPRQPLALETFVNVADEIQRSDYAHLAEQDRLRLLFYDEALAHRLTKAVAVGDRQTIRRIVTEADHLYAAIPTTRFDFDRAKAAVLEATRL